jgi:hypothetical protein
LDAIPGRLFFGRGQDGSNARVACPTQGCLFRRFDPSRGSRYNRF